jgi:hypothetical protein
MKVVIVTVYVSCSGDICESSRMPSILLSICAIEYSFPVVLCSLKKYITGVDYRKLLSGDVTNVQTHFIPHKKIMR